MISFIRDLLIIILGGCCWNGQTVRPLAQMNGCRGSIIAAELKRTKYRRMNPNFLKNGLSAGERPNKDNTRHNDDGGGYPRRMCTVPGTGTPVTQVVLGSKKGNSRMVHPFHLVGSDSHTYHASNLGHDCTGTVRVQRLLYKYRTGSRDRELKMRGNKKQGNNRRIIIIIISIYVK